MKRYLNQTICTTQNLAHKHSIIYDYENGEKICNLCGIVIKDKIIDSELQNEYPKKGNDTNTALPYSLALYDQGIATSIDDSYKFKTKEGSTNKNQSYKIEFLNKIVSHSNEKRNLKIVY